jgi:hypothetical protein
MELYFHIVMSSFYGACIQQIFIFLDRLLGGNIDTIKKNTEFLIDASKEIGVEINVDKT